MEEFTGEINKDLNFTQESIPNNNFDFVSIYRNLLNSEKGEEEKKKLEEIAFPEKVGVWNVGKFSLESVNWMLNKPGLFQGVDIPNSEELISVKKILSARLVLEERHPDKKYSVN